jgi:hypothetical protein
MIGYVIEINDYWQSTRRDEDWTDWYYTAFVKKVPTQKEFARLIEKWTKEKKKGTSKRVLDSWVSAAKKCKSFRDRLGEWQKFPAFTDYLQKRTISFCIKPIEWLDD